VPSPKLAPAHEPLAALLKRLVESVPMYQDVAAPLDDAAWVGGRLVELLPFSLELKQSLLETRDPLARLERIAAALEPRQTG